MWVPLLNKLKATYSVEFIIITSTDPKPLMDFHSIHRNMRTESLNGACDRMFRVAFEAGCDTFNFRFGEVLYVDPMNNRKMSPCERSCFIDTQGFHFR